MKASTAMKMVGGALIVLASLNASAQSSDAAAAPAAAAAASSAATGKQAKAANRALGRKVRSALAKTKGVSVANISVRPRGGAVTLAGTVPDQSQIDLATQAAQGVGRRDVGQECVDGSSGRAITGSHERRRRARRAGPTGSGGAAFGRRGAGIRERASDKPFVVFQAVSREP
ncbi:MAG: Predicted periplasmic or secreted lipoprotein [uncultured Paraburkholderia sp.]|nr:MAG: Predicted periplasmic or secreted lipoprotein [uncultured Paraburkholderia sp.]